ncbi:hypothetical protein EVAR_61775_1 [Eumeta japonica]|uniref:Uncharacterized protein n=1 Tax=Eumeta variegata TaxID=151549 RepID=A0A4C1Z417_EUMVA|nr:hypothetical protein EVAR_61775_1 [Eumeta japonica]
MSLTRMRPPPAPAPPPANRLSPRNLRQNIILQDNQDAAISSNYSANGRVTEPGGIVLGCDLVDESLRGRGGVIRDDVRNSSDLLLYSLGARTLYVSGVSSAPAQERRRGARCRCCIES